MNGLQQIEILEALAALEVAAAGVGLDHELYMLREKLREIEYRDHKGAQEKTAYRRL